MIYYWDCCILICRCMHNITTHNKDDARHSLLEKYTSHFIWKVCVWEAVGDRIELRHIDPHSYGHQRLFPVLLGCSIGAWGPASLGAGFLYRILSLTGLVSKLNRESRGSLLPGAGFLYHILSPTDWISCALSYITVHAHSITHHDRPRAEIIVMQFTGHSLPVHQSVTVPWDFNPVPYCQPSPPTPMEYALPPSLEWHVWPGRRSIYNKTRAMKVIWNTSSKKIHPFS